jgi:hypothetical protein
MQGRHDAETQRILLKEKQLGIAAFEVGAHGDFGMKGKDTSGQGEQADEQGSHAELNEAEGGIHTGRGAGSKPGT